MTRSETHLVLAVAAILGAASAAMRLAAQRITPPVKVVPSVAAITVDYPIDDSVFPPDMTAPIFIWRDADQKATEWMIKVVFSDGSPSLQIRTEGGPVRLGETDERCVAPTNQRPTLTPQQIAARTWTPGAEIWQTVRTHSTGHPATVQILSVRSYGQVTIQTSKDPVGAPIFYRDVPLMPEETQRGVIQPLGTSALPLIAWRLRALGETRSRLLLEGMPTCANCHSFSGDGKTLAMDLDGPQNDKGLYAIAAIGPRMSIRQEDVIEWSSFREKVAAESRVGFMSQVSPDGQYVVTTVNRSDYVANFKDYRFLQVFYPTRGVLAWYSRSRREMHLLPGADDPHYVQTSAVWSPDGKYLVFARADAREAYPAGNKAARYANDPAETQIRYDLFRIPFNDGRGGRAEPITGASKNGMSNSFPKISPDGRWLVYVQARNGQLMRPDSQLYVVPAGGGRPRRMRCNMALMNSWHSFSPNGHWLVFSSKADSPYTGMFLTHLDEQGRDSPAIRIENATAANRAVNIPEFVNLPADGLLAIDVPAADFYRVFSRGLELTGQGKFEAAVTEWNRAIELAPEDAKSHNNLGFALAQLGRLRDALVHLQKAVELNPAYAAGHNNLALALQSLGRIGEAIEHWQSALESNPASAAVHNNLAGALYSQGRTAEALLHWRAVLRVEPDRPSALQKTAWVLATASEPELRDGRQAVALAERAIKLSVGDDPAALDTLAAAYAEAGRFADAIGTAQRALQLAAAQTNQSLIKGLTERIALYRGGTPFRERTTGAVYQK